MEASRGRDWSIHNAEIPGINNYGLFTILLIPVLHQISIEIGEVAIQLLF
jgi:hypothetical protein